MTLMKIINKAQTLIPGIAALIDLLWVPPQKFYSGSWLMGELGKGHWKEAGDIVVYKLSGVNLPERRFDIAAAINPLDLDAASTTKLAVWTGITMQAVKSVGSFFKSLFAEMT